MLCKVSWWFVCPSSFQPKTASINSPPHSVSSQAGRRKGSALFALQLPPTPTRVPFSLLGLIASNFLVSIWFFHSTLLLRVWCLCEEGDSRNSPLVPSCLDCSYLLLENDIDSTEWDTLEHTSESTAERPTFSSFDDVEDGSSAATPAGNTHTSNSLRRWLECAGGQWGVLYEQVFRNYGLSRCIYLSYVVWRLLPWWYLYIVWHDGILCSCLLMSLTPFLPSSEEELHTCRAEDLPDLCAHLRRCIPKPWHVMRLEREVKKLIKREK